MPTAPQESLILKMACSGVTLKGTPMKTPSSYFYVYLAGHPSMVRDPA